MHETSIINLYTYAWDLCTYAWDLFLNLYIYNYAQKPLIIKTPVLYSWSMSSKQHPLASSCSPTKTTYTPTAAAVGLWTHGFTRGTWDTEVHATLGGRHHHHHYQITSRAAQSQSSQEKLMILEPSQREGITKRWGDGVWWWCVLLHYYCMWDTVQNDYFLSLLPVLI